MCQVGSFLLLGLLITRFTQMQACVLLRNGMVRLIITSWRLADCWFLVRGWRGLLTSLLAKRLKISSRMIRNMKEQSSVV